MVHVVIGRDSSVQGSPGQNCMKHLNEKNWIWAIQVITEVLLEKSSLPVIGSFRQ